MNWHFRVTPTPDNTFSWWLRGDDARTVACAGMSYTSHSAALQAAAAFQAGAGTAGYEIFLEEGRGYRWRATHDGTRLGISGESFSEATGAERAAEMVAARTDETERVC